MKIASYLDYYDWTIDYQLKQYHRNELDYFILRKINGLPFTKYFDHLNEIAFKLKKTKVGFFDPLLPPIDFDNDQVIKDLTSACRFARKVKTKNIVIQIKPFSIETTKSQLETYFKEIKKITKRLKILIKIDQENEMFIFHKISNEISDNKVKLIFNPVSIYLKNNSPTSSYRLFSKKIGLFEVADINKDLEDVLVGHGEIKIKELFKYLYQDRYNHLISLNSNLDHVFKNFGINPLEVSKKEKRESLKKYLETIHKMGYISYNKSEEVAFEDIINHQIKLLKIVFK